MKALKATVICFLACYVLDSAMTGGRYSAVVLNSATQIYGLFHSWARS
jgi:hypothetical protein